MRFARQMPSALADRFLMHLVASSRSVFCVIGTLRSNFLLHKKTVCHDENHFNQNKLFFICYSNFTPFSERSHRSLLLFEFHYYLYRQLKSGGIEIFIENYCAFSKNHKYLNWTDYELTRYEIEEAGSLCQAN